MNHHVCPSLCRCMREETELLLHTGSFSQAVLTCSGVQNAFCFRDEFDSIHTSSSGGSVLIGLAVLKI